MPRVLVIEDNLTNLDLIVYLLECTGHEVIATTNGRDGVRRAIEREPDLILCDIQLPDIDGYEVLQEVRRELAAVPVIAVTAYAMVGDREKILAAGFDGYLAKPIEPETFLSELAGYLGKDA